MENSLMKNINLFKFKLPQWEIMNTDDVYLTYDFELGLIWGNGKDEDLKSSFSNDEIESLGILPDKWIVEKIKIEK